MGRSWSLRSKWVYPVNSPVCVLSRAVGTMAVLTPAAESTGSATVSEQRPTQEISCTASARFCILSPPSYLRMATMIHKSTKNASRTLTFRPRWGKVSRMTIS